MIEAVSRDNGNVTEVEQKLVLACESEIKDEGKLKQDTIDAIEKIMAGEWEAGKTIEIGGIEFTSEELQNLVMIADQLGMSLDGLDLGDTGLEEEAQKAKELKEAIDGITNTEIRIAIDSQGFETSTQVENILSVVDKIVNEWLAYLFPTLFPFS